MTGKDTVKGRNTLRNSRVMLSVDDERPPFAFVLIQGEAAASEPSLGFFSPTSCSVLADAFSPTQRPRGTSALVVFKTAGGLESN